MKELKGAAKITHALKEYGDNQSMKKRNTTLNGRESKGGTKRRISARGSVPEVDTF